MEAINGTRHNLLYALRALSPPRPLTRHEAEPVAERQANCLLGHLPESDRLTLEAALTRLLPSLRVVHDADLPASGTVHWSGRQWIVALSGTDGSYRQRETLLHLLKRIIDHGRPPLVVPTSHSPAVAAEQLADYFAACVLLPEALVVAAWNAGLRIKQLSRRFNVPDSVMAARLDEIRQTQERRMSNSERADDEVL